jgi:hypothetical protein
MKTTAYLITVLSIFFSICDTKNFGSELPPDVLTAIRENQKTIDSVKTFHATTKRTDHMTREQGKRTMFVVQEVWYDGSRFRIDVKDSKFIGKNTTDLVLEKYPDGGVKVFAPPPVRSWEIRLKESRLAFHGGDRVIIYPYQWDKENIVSQCPILRFSMFRFTTLQEQVLRNKRQGYIWSAQSDSLDGEECILLSCSYPDYHQSAKAWVVPAKGYCIKKRQSTNQGTVAFEYETTLKEYSPGFWWFDRVVQKRRKTGEKDPFEIIELSIEKIEFNKPLDPKVFTIAGTNIPKGTRITDRISGRDYVYGISPISATPLINKPLPELEAVGVDVLPSDTNDRMILVCFFDMEQRPSRSCVVQLARRAPELEERDVVVVAIHASKVDESKLGEWLKKNDVPFPAGTVAGDEERLRFTWGVKSLPWLILTDRNHVVTAEGFGLAELGDELKRISEK